MHKFPEAIYQVLENDSKLLKKALKQVMKDGK